MRKPGDPITTYSRGKTYQLVKLGGGSRAHWVEKSWVDRGVPLGRAACGRRGSAYGNPAGLDLCQSCLEEVGVPRMTWR